MKIITFPKFYMEKRAKEGNPKDRILISILSTVDTPLDDNIVNAYRDSIRMRFDDIELSWKDMQKDDLPEEYYGLTPFKAIHTMQIKQVLDNNPGVDIDIHCTAGVSRSGAVAAGIAMHLNDEKLLANTVMHNNILPNNYVLSMLHTHLGTKIHMPMYKIYNMVKARMELNKTRTIMGGTDAK